jgi:hypothetical protein
MHPIIIMKTSFQYAFIGILFYYNGLNHGRRRRAYYTKTGAQRLVMSQTPTHATKYPTSGAY